MKRKVYIVSNRLPVTIEKAENTIIHVRSSSGGLVSAINAFFRSDNNLPFEEIVWAGVPNCEKEEWELAMKAYKATQYNFLPVFVDETSYDNYYRGFSNSIIWPLFHYFPHYIDYNDDYFNDYRKVNGQFCRVLQSCVSEHDIVWIHDYHLFPLASLLRKAIPGLTIGFFLHIPFPSYELFRTVPRRWQRYILAGVLDADLIGFQTSAYAAHFKTAVSKVLKASVDTEDNIRWKQKVSKVGVFPISVDYDSINNASQNLNNHPVKEQFRQLAQGKKIIFSIDRLDYIKGISNRLKGFEWFLLNNPCYRGKVVFILAIIPSRDSIIAYSEKKKMIDEQVSDINSRIGNITWQPIIYYYNHLSQEELLSLYTICDIALITPVRDGMNLVAKEFIASRFDRRGVLILSEMAGASEELQEALLVNPNDMHELTAAIRHGLEMPEQEQYQKMYTLQERIKMNNVNTWAESFFSVLDKAAMSKAKLPEQLNEQEQALLFSKYKNATKRAFFLDYDGTLSEIVSHPEDAVPCRRLLNILTFLSAQVNTDVYLISGRSSDILEQWLGALPVTLIAEHGAAIKDKGGKWLSLIAEAEQLFSKIEHIMYKAVVLCEGTTIERKRYSMVWHYRNADPKQVNLHMAILVNELNEAIKGSDYILSKGEKIVEIRSSRTHKGTIVQQFLQDNKYDFICCAGDDSTDEDMFEIISDNKNAIGIKIGRKASKAHYYMESPAVFIALLSKMALGIKPVRKVMDITFDSIDSK